jgi:hypothetical protein
MANAFKGLLAGAVVGAIAWSFREYQKGQEAQAQAVFIPASTSQPSTPSVGKSLLSSFLGNLLDTVPDSVQDAAQAVGVSPNNSSSVPSSSGTTAPPSGSARDIGPDGVDFAAYERKYGLPKGYLRTTAKIESSLNPAAQNPHSSAGGLFQFIDATARDYGLANRFDAAQATDAASRLARDNARTLKSVLGRDPTGGELYLAHQQGGGGARKLLRDRGARAVDVVGLQQVKLNGGTETMTAGQFADLWIGKLRRYS